MNPKKIKLYCRVSRMCKCSCGFGKNLMMCLSLLTSQTVTIRTCIKAYNVTLTAHIVLCQPHIIFRPWPGVCSIRVLREKSLFSSSTGQLWFILRGLGWRLIWTKSHFIELIRSNLGNVDVPSKFPEASWKCRLQLGFHRQKGTHINSHKILHTIKLCLLKEEWPYGH